MAPLTRFGDFDRRFRTWRRDSRYVDMIARALDREIERIWSAYRDVPLKFAERFPEPINWKLG